MKKIMLIFFTILLAIFTSCNKVKLSNDEAKDLVIKTLNLPVSFRHDVDKRPSMGSQFELGGLRDAGLITGSEYLDSRRLIEIQITKLGKSSFIGENNNAYMFKTNEIDFNQITGISINKEAQTAIIRFSLKATNVTLAAYALAKTDRGWSGKKYINYSLTGPITGELVYKKFDNGWQLESEQGKSSSELLNQILESESNANSNDDYSQQIQILRDEINSKSNDSSVSSEISSTSEENRIEFNQSDANALHILQGKWYGTIGKKILTLNIETVGASKMSGYNIAGNNQRPISGSYSFYNDGRICILELKEPGDDKWDGTFKIEMEVYSDNWAGTGTWQAYNGQLSNPVSISRRPPDNPNDFIAPKNSSNDGDKFIGVWVNSNNDKVKISKSGEIYKVAYQPDEDDIFDFEAPYKNGTIKCPFGQDNKDTITFSLVGNQLKFVGDWDGSHPGPETYLFNRK